MAKAKVTYKVEIGCYGGWINPSWGDAAYKVCDGDLKGWNSDGFTYTNLDKAISTAIRFAVPHKRVIEADTGRIVWEKVGFKEQWFKG